jgi:hypothetical protein
MFWRWCLVFGVDVGGGVGGGGCIGGGNVGGGGGGGGGSGNGEAIRDVNEKKSLIFLNQDGLERFFRDSSISLRMLFVLFTRFWCWCWRWCSVFGVGGGGGGGGDSGCVGGGGVGGGDGVGVCVGGVGGGVGGGGSSGDVSANGEVIPRNAHSAANEHETLRFLTEEDFKLFFCDQFILMRMLLVRFSTVSNSQQAITIPKFHLEKQFSNTVVSKAFFETFQKDSFRREGKEWLSNHVDVKLVATILESPLRVITSKISALVKEEKLLQGKLNAGTLVLSKHRRQDVHPKERGVNAAHFYIRNSTQVFMADGNDTNAELTRPSLDKISEVNDTCM